MVFNFKKYRSFFIFILTASVIVYTIFIPKNYARAEDCTDPDYARSHESYCRLQLTQFLEEEARLLKELEKQSKKSANYASEVKRLTTEIGALKTKIKARENSIALLKNDINNKTSKIKTLTSKIDREKQSLSQLIRKERQIDNISIVSLVLSNDNISDIYGDISNFSSIKEEIQNSIDKITGTKRLTEAERLELEKKKEQENDAKYELESTQKKTAQIEAKQRELLAGSKNQEATLAKVAAEKKAQAEKIRSALIKFQGSGISSKSISFGEAYDYAKKASLKTGVRAALILAIMQQETGFGNNVGGCYVTDLKTGDGVGIQSGADYERVMGIGSLSIFKRITEGLGFAWNKTPVSCPIDIKGYGTATKYYDGRGYGGAMGYTQFIPSTWALVEKRVESYLGVKMANPWSPSNAVMATAVFLQDLGAGAQTYTSEKNAACRYYSGSSCPVILSSDSDKTKKFKQNVINYGVGAVNKAASIELDINKLEDL